MLCRLLISATCLAVLTSSSYGQAVRSEPYNAQLRTSPEVGNVQGIQRYGRPLRTDPDQGEGYSYHVYPVANSSGVLVTPTLIGAPQRTRRENELQELESKLKGILPQLKSLEEKSQKDAVLQPAVQQLRSDYQATLLEYNRKLLEVLQEVRSSPASVVGGQVPAVPPASVPYPAPFNPTAGLRNAAPVKPPADGSDPKPAPGLPPITHQPLIQVKVRVVQVDRSNGLQVSSVLDYIRMPGNPNSSLISGNNVNQNMRNLSGGTRFINPAGFIDFTGTTLASLTPAGALVNLTSGNLNAIVRLLQEEFHADTITAPQVATLNGQNVEFVAGQRMPFLLGQNVINGSTNNIQQFFYKHVGTFISVTPRIVNWGPRHGAGRGKAPLREADVKDWRAFLRKLREDVDLTRLKKDQEVADYLAWEECWSEQPGRGEPLVPASIKDKILAELSEYSRKDLLARGFPIWPGDVLECDGSGCDWRPQDCTIDLEVIVRLSNTTTTKIGIAVGAGVPQELAIPAEENIRAIADVVQVKSGHGVVMGGLIGESEVKNVSKVPVLGDIPIVGAAFRSKSTVRQKTETLIFIEAEVLDSEPLAARAQSARDHRLSEAHVAGDLQDSPLETGMYRAGFGPYLPPRAVGGGTFWQRLTREARGAATAIGDIFTR